MEKSCMSCGARINENASFCKSCGATVKSKSSEQPNQFKGNSTFTNSDVAATSVLAEINLGSVFSLSDSVVPILGPVKYLGNRFIGIIKGIKSVFKDKKKLIPIILLAVTWIVLTLLPMLGINSVPIKVLSYLTFAKPGTTGGWFEITGGLVGKSIFAFFITSMAVPLFSRNKLSISNKSTGSTKGGVSQFFTSISESIKNTSLLPALLLGCAVSLLLYNFMTGDNSIQKSMLGIIALLLSLRALAGKTGFLRGFLTSWINKFKKKKADTAVAGKMKDINKTISRFIAGITLGFALAIPLSTIPFPYTAYIAGAVLIIASIIFAIVSKDKAEVTA